MQLDLENRKQALALAVIRPLKDGLQSFNTVSEMLLSMEADFILPGCQTFHDIRKHIENMKRELDKSEQAARNELKRLDGDTERLTAEQGKVARQKQASQREVANLYIHLNSQKAMLDQYRASLNTAWRNLQTAQATLNDQRNKRDEAERIRNAGIGIMFIPIVGWIAGGAMVGVGQMDLDRYSDAVNTASSEVQNCESQISVYSYNVSRYESDIQKVQQDIQLADRRISETEALLKCLSRDREVVADIQAKTRRAVNQLGELSAVGNVAEVQTRHLVQLEALMMVMQEMTSALGRITGADSLLHSEGIRGLMQQMKSNHKKLCDKAKNERSSGFDNYW